MDNYEQKYNEALERARSMYESKDDAELAAFIFPELKESEDERIIQNLINAFTEYKKSGGVDFHGIEINTLLAWLEKQKEQKPAEWSEEDEKRIKQLIYDTEAIRAGYEKKKEQLGDRFNDALIKDCDEQIRWLKSLRPQPHWNPSEEQMEHLQRAINCYESDWGENKLLRSLIYDLKNMM